MVYKNKRTKKRILYEREWRRKNKERLNRLSRARYEQNPERYKAHQKRYYDKNSEKCRERTRKWYKKTRLSRMTPHILRFHAMQIVSGRRIPRCGKCGERKFIVLIIHHKNGIKDGKQNEERTHLHRKILNGERKTNDLEILCCNCNRIAEIERGNIIYNEKMFEKRLKEEKLIRESDSIK